MLTIFHVPLTFRSTTRFLLREAIGHLHDRSPFPDYSSVLCILPSQTMVRNAHAVFHGLAVESIAAPNGAICYIPPEMVTVDQLSKSVSSISARERFLDNSLIPVILSRLSDIGIGYATLIADFLRDLRRHFPRRGAEDIRSVFGTQFEMLNIPESARIPFFRCLDILHRYSAFKEERSLADGGDLLVSCLDRLSGLSPKALIVHGFHDPDASERDLLRTLIERADKTFVALPADTLGKTLSASFLAFLKGAFDHEEVVLPSEDDALRSRTLEYASYPDPEAEVEGIARTIKSRFLSGRAQELENVVVTFPETNAYAPMVERVFGRYGIPFQQAGGRPLAERRPFLDLVCLVSSMAEDYPRLPFAQFLSSPSFRKIPESLRTWIPLLSLQSGIISGKDRWLNLAAQGSELIDQELLRRTDIEKDLRAIFAKLARIEVMKSGGTFSQFASDLAEVIEDLGFLQERFAPEGTAETADDLRDERKALDTVLERLVFIGTLFPNPVSLSEFNEVLIHLLKVLLPEKAGTGVKIMACDEIGELSPDHLYLGNLTDHAMPRKQDLDHFLPDSIKKRLGLLYFDKHLARQHFAFVRSIASAGNVSLSYPATTGDTMNLPSPFLYGGVQVARTIPGIFSREEFLLTQRAAHLASHIAEIRIAPPQLSFHRVLKVTDVDAYRFCPRRFFIDKVARIKPLDVKEYEVEAVTLGIILHRIMEKIIQAPLEPFEELREKALTIADETMQERKIPAYWKRLIRDAFIEILPEIHDKEIEIRQEGYVSSTVEKTITGEPIRGIKLKGKIDRFDRVGDAVQILDYKTGTAGLTCSQVARGNENLQLFLYAAIMKSQDYRVDRVGIYSLKDIQVKWCPVKRRGKSKCQETIDDYIAASLPFLEEAVKGMRAGDFTARPLNEYNCRNCHEYAWCPYIQQ